MNPLKRRVDELEQQGRKFTGYACVEVWAGQTVDQAKVEWERKNGPIADRQVVLWNFGGLDAA